MNEQIKKIKDEVERLYEEAKNEPYTGEAEGEMVAYDKLLSFIDSLQDEPNAEETELNSLAFLEQLGYTCIPPKESWPPQDNTPTYASTEYKVNVTKGELDYNSPEIKVLVKGPSIEEKSEIPTNLEEEVNKYWNDHSLEYRLGRVADIDFLHLTARHFAEWQKKQDEKDLTYKVAAAYQLGSSDAIKKLKKNCNIVDRQYAEIEQEKKCQGCFDRDEVFYKGMQHARDEMMKDAIPFREILKAVPAGPERDTTKILILKDDETSKG